MLRTQGRFQSHRSCQNSLKRVFEYGSVDITVVKLRGMVDAFVVGLIRWISGSSQQRRSGPESALLFRRQTFYVDGKA